jgi:DNA replication protein DnaC
VARRPRPGDEARGVPPEEELAQLADDLDLTAIRVTYAAIVAAAEKERCSFTEFALRLLRAEATQRQTRRLERSFRRSRLGPDPGLDGFDWSIRPGLDARVVRELLHCRFVGERRGIVCIGPSGTGKTHVCRAIGHAAVRLGYTVLYTTAAEMVENLAASLVDGTYKRMLRRYAKPEVLVVDEFGLLGFDKNAARHLFRLVSERYQKSSTIIAANTGFRRWKTFFPSEAECVATVDRLVDKATILRFSGKPSRGPQDTHGAPLPDES